MKKPNRKPTAKEIEEAMPGWKTVGPVAKARIIARNATMRAARAKDARITMRANADDLERLKQIAVHEGVKYQTLLGQIIRKFVRGTLVETAAPAIKKTRKAR